MHAASTSHASNACSAHLACTQRARCTHRGQSTSAPVVCIGPVDAAGALHAVSACSGLFRCMGCKQRANRMPLMRVAAAADTCSNRCVCTKLVRCGCSCERLRQRKRGISYPSNTIADLGARGDCSLVSAQPPAKMRLPLPWPGSAHHKSKTARRVRLDDDRMTTASALPATASRQRATAAGNSNASTKLLHQINQMQTFTIFKSISLTRPLPPEIKSRLSHRHLETPKMFARISRVANAAQPEINDSAEQLNSNMFARAPQPESSAYARNQMKTQIPTTPQSGREHFARTMQAVTPDAK